MAFDISISFDMTDPQDKAWTDRILDYKRSRALGIPHDLVARVKRTKVFRDFVEPLAKSMSDNQPYTAAQMAGLLGTDWTTRKIVSKLNSLGRPETRYRARIFE